MLADPHSPASRPSLHQLRCGSLAALFVGFPATMTGSDFSGPCVIGYGSSPSRCEPRTRTNQLDTDGQTRDLPASRCDPFARDVALDPGRASAPRNDGAAHVAFERMKTLGPCDINLSRLNPTPHAIAVYASQPLSPVTTQHSLPSGRYSLLRPDFTRWIAPACGWRTHSMTPRRRGRVEELEAASSPQRLQQPSIDHKLNLSIGPPANSQGSHL